MGRCYNRGTRVVSSAEADQHMPAANARADRQAHKDEVTRLREQVAKLERELARAHRCIAAERNGRELLRLRLAEEVRSNESARSILCRLAFK